MVRLKVKVPAITRYFSIKFQFLMVRLKGCFIIQRKKEILISIPYGAIKRFYKNNRAKTTI